MLAAQQQTLRSEDRLSTQLVTLAAKGLEQMYDPQQRLFCFKLMQSADGIVREGVSHRYTMMTLLGLHRLEAAGYRSPADIQSVLEALLQDISWINGAGDLGLLLWTCAEIAPERLPHLFARMHAGGALRRFADGRQVYTMEVAWFLAGIAHCLIAAPGHFSSLAEDGVEAFQLLKRNCGTGGIFGHLATDKSMAGRLRGRIGSFADQVYPIYALAKFGAITGSREAIEHASLCAQSICQHQGPNGEWWWHYDSTTGNIAETYPVYSVHQDGMAPMALFALAEVTGADFTGPIQNGLNWISGSNDLHFDMRSESDHLVWRNFYLPAPSRYWRQIVGRASHPDTTPVQKLLVNYECRPYELGWMLYALAGPKMPRV